MKGQGAVTISLTCSRSQQRRATWYGRGTRLHLCFWARRSRLLLAWLKDGRMNNANYRWTGRGSLLVRLITVPPGRFRRCGWLSHEKEKYAGRYQRDSMSLTGWRGGVMREGCRADGSRWFDKQDAEISVRQKRKVMATRTAYLCADRQQIPLSVRQGCC